MSVRKKVSRSVIAAKSIYIDPLDCDSTVAYKIIKRGTARVWGNVQLSDCSRKIDWYFGSGQPVEKINNAIAALEEFRDALVKARKTLRVRRIVKK